LPRSSCFCGARPLAEELDRVAAVREAVGAGVRIMVDTNERLDQPDALWFGRQLAAHDVYWLAGSGGPGA
jgi:L-alanine-DL-glutamate epimerase-like enolase superfamily enzyme